MSLFGSAKETFFALSEGIDELELSDEELRAADSVDIGRASEYIAQCEKSGVSVIGYSSSEYPAQLRHIFNPPAVLY